MTKPLRGMRVLVAEDDLSLALDLKDTLSNAGAEVIGPVATLTDTLVLAKSASLTCAVLDIHLADNLVFPAAQILKVRGIAIIFHTGYEDLDGLKRAWPEAKVFAKPASFQALMLAVQATRKPQRALWLRWLDLFPSFGLTPG